MEINVLIDEDFEEHPRVSRLRSVAEQVLIVQDTSSDVELSLVITTQERVELLNKSCRKKNEPTDVLAFSMISAAGVTGTGSPSFVVPLDGEPYLGEVIISYTQVVIPRRSTSIP